MIDHYSTLFHQLFDGSYSALFHDFYNNQKQYDGCGRTGDNYVKRLFKATILNYYDRFGNNEFEQTYKLLYLWAYKLRLEKYSVRYNSTDNYILINGNNIFKIMQHTNFPRELQSLKQLLPIREVDLKQNIGKILDVFDEQKLLIKKLY